MHVYSHHSAYSAHKTAFGARIHLQRYVKQVRKDDPRGRVLIAEGSIRGGPRNGAKAALYYYPYQGAENTPASLGECSGFPMHLAWRPGFSLSVTHNNHPQAGLSGSRLQDALLSQKESGLEYILKADGEVTKRLKIIHSHTRSGRKRTSDKQAEMLKRLAAWANRVIKLPEIE